MLAFPRFFVPPRRREAAGDASSSVSLRLCGCL